MWAPVSWLVRMRARRHLRTRLGIWYHPEYALHSLAGAARVAHVDVRRGERVAGALVGERLMRGSDLRHAAPVTMQALLRVHDPDYIEASADARVLARVLSLAPSDVPVDDVLRAVRRATGGTVEAARAAAAREVAIAFNVGGGYHHAEPEQGGGFCIYNDVAVAIASLRAEGFDGRVAVVDLDYHQGNGTRVVFADDPTVLTWSIHGSVWGHSEAIADVGFVMPPGTDDVAYLELLAQQLELSLAAFQPSLVFYLAGNDVLAGDRLGDFALTPAGVFERDRHVTEVTRRLGASLVATMAGGYSDRAWRSTFAYLTWLLTDRAHAFEATDGDVTERFERIARSLDQRDLQREHDELTLTTEDVMAELDGASRQRRMLGFYSRHGLELALERYGFFDVLRDLGFEDFVLEIDPADPSRQIIRVEGRRRGSQRPRVMLVELVLRLREVLLRDLTVAATGTDHASGEPMRLLALEWLLLQDPTRPFSLERPPLPGQAHPGLGCGREVLELLAQVCKRLGLDGVSNAPGHYHVALFAAGRMQFVDPRSEGRFAAMRRVLAGWDIAEATAIVDECRLALADGSRVPWRPDELILPISGRLRSWLFSERYRELRDRERDRLLAAGLSVQASTRPAASPSPP